MSAYFFNLYFLQPLNHQCSCFVNVFIYACIFFAQQYFLFSLTIFFLSLTSNSDALSGNLILMCGCIISEILYCFCLIYTIYILLLENDLLYFHLWMKFKCLKTLLRMKLYLCLIKRFMFFCHVKIVLWISCNLRFVFFGNKLYLNLNKMSCDYNHFLIESSLYSLFISLNWRGGSSRPILVKYSHVNGVVIRLLLLLAEVFNDVIVKCDGVDSSSVCCASLESGSPLSLLKYW